MPCTCGSAEDRNPQVPFSFVRDFCQPATSESCGGRGRIMDLTRSAVQAMYTEACRGHSHVPTNCREPPTQRLLRARFSMRELVAADDDGDQTGHLGDSAGKERLE